MSWGGGRRLSLVGVLSWATRALRAEGKHAVGDLFGDGKTGQGLPVGIQLSTDLSAVTRFAIGWRARCSPGGAFFEITVVSKPIAVRPFPNFHRTGSYVVSTVSNVQTVHVFSSVQLHGALARNGRASGT
jgi:hypothetical protein